MGDGRARAVCGSKGEVMKKNLFAVVPVVFDLTQKGKVTLHV
jgi:hypothetical protein